MKHVVAFAALAPTLALGSVTTASAESITIRTRDRSLHRDFDRSVHRGYRHRDISTGRPATA